MSPPPNDDVKPFGFLEVTVLISSAYVLVALFVQTAFRLSPEVDLLMERIDTLICFVFLAEFGIRFRRAPSKFAFLKWGWIDLVSSIPAYDFLRWGRLVRMIRIVRILRAFRSARHIVAYLFRNRAKGFTLTAMLSAFVLVASSCIAILVFEDSPDSNIRTSFDAFWWAISTMTTVGYGDRFPVTIEGKIVAMILMIAGVGLFGVLTGLFARLYVEPQLRREDQEIKEVLAEIRELKAKIERIEDRYTDGSSST